MSIINPLNNVVIDLLVEEKKVSKVRLISIHAWVIYLLNENIFFDPKREMTPQLGQQGEWQFSRKFAFFRNLLEQYCFVEISKFIGKTWLNQK